MPELGAGQAEEELRAGVGRRAARHHTALGARDVVHVVLVEAARCGLAECRVVGAQAAPAAGHGKARIDIGLACRHVGVDAVEHLRAVQRLVEAQVQERLHRIAGLRRPLAQRVSDAARHRIGRAGTVRGLAAEEAHGVPQRGQAHAHHLRVLRHVHEFVEILRIEAAAQADAGRVGRAGEGVGAGVAGGEFPVAGGNRHARIGLVDAPRERVAGLGVVEAGRRVGDHGAVEHAAGQGHRRRGRAWHQFGPIGARDRGAIGILRHRHRHGQPRRAGLRHIALPGRVQQHVAALQVDRVARARGGVDHGQDIAAIGRVVAQHAAGLAHVLGLEHDEVGRVLDHAVCVDGRQRQVLDDGVPGVLRIDLAADGARQLLVLPHAAVAAREVLCAGDLERLRGRMRLGRASATAATVPAAVVVVAATTGRQHGHGARQGACGQQRQRQGQP
ncbi:hypothetical protein D3C86_1293940 [compost metagenome]